MDWGKAVPKVKAIDRGRRGAVFRLNQLETEAGSLETRLDELITARTKRESAPLLLRFFYRLVYSNRKERNVMAEIKHYTIYISATKESINALESEQISHIERVSTE